MRLACPECGTEYDVPDAALGVGRRLRCSACSANWEWTPSQVAEEPNPPPGEPAAAREPEAAAPTTPAEPRADSMREPEPAAVEPPRIGSVPEPRVVPPPPPPRQPRPPRPPARGGRTVMLAWVASIVFLATVLGALYVWRVPVIQAWPPAARLYAALGLA